ncbi:MAG: hypothetical protein Q9227_002701 [Pyrenula ochraceoflavens]
MLGRCVKVDAACRPLRVFGIICGFPDTGSVSIAVDWPTSMVEDTLEDCFVLRALSGFGAFLVLDDAPELLVGSSPEKQPNPAFGCFADNG